VDTKRSGRLPGIYGEQTIYDDCPYCVSFSPRYSIHLLTINCNSIESGTIYPLALIVFLILQKLVEIEFYTQYALLIQVVVSAKAHLVVKSDLVIYFHS
jgi:hypothetical protein